MHEGVKVTGIGSRGTIWSAKRRSSCPTSTSASIICALPNVRDKGVPPQGLVTVPFWEYGHHLIVAIIDHIYLMVGWCSTGTFNDPCPSLMIFLTFRCTNGCSASVFYFGWCSQHSSQVCTAQFTAAEGWEVPMCYLKLVVWGKQIKF